jgi:hypothetical protein
MESSTRLLLLHIQDHALHPAPLKRPSTPPNHLPSRPPPLFQKSNRPHLCAIVSTVQSTKAVRMVDWIRLSVALSTLEVASSSTRIRDDRSSARAMQSSWRWPAERLLPPSWMGESRPDWRLGMDRVVGVVGG